MHHLFPRAAAVPFISDSCTLQIFKLCCHHVNGHFSIYVIFVALCRSTAVETARDQTYRISVRGLSYKIATSDPDGKKSSGESVIELAHPHSGPIGPGAPLETENKRGSWGSTNKYLLKDVTCDAFPGELMAIAGPSGAGKSTLLDALAGRIRLKSLEGEILVNGRHVESKQFRRITGESCNSNSYVFIV